MTNNSEKNSTSKEGSGHLDFKFCCGNSEEMSRMMRKFRNRNNKDGTINCRKMMHLMQKMCCAPSEKSGQ